MHCSYCGSIDFKGLGVHHLGNKRKSAYKCMKCGEKHYEDYSPPKPVFDESYVITSATDGFPTNKRFLKVLENYCAVNGSKLVILPVNNNAKFNDGNYDDDVKKYLTADNIHVGTEIVILGTAKLGTNLENPLRSLDAFSKGKTVVFGHPQVQLKTLPRKSEMYPPIMTTTGSVSIPKYTENKTAQKANFNHSYSALFISKNGQHLRHLNFDGEGFYDIGKYYTEESVSDENKISAIVTGDEHVMFYNKGVFEATYGSGGIVETLKPDYIVRHDVLDCYSISHHHHNNVFIKYGKRLANIDSIQEELNVTLDFIENTTPPSSQSVIVPSNHNSHLLRWLNECNPKHDMVNAKIYHQLMYLMLDNLKVDDNVPVYPDPFALYGKLKKTSDNVRFLSTDDNFIVEGIDLNNHGDLGINGTRGSRIQYNQLPLKTIIGHSHSPGIEKGSYQVGTSSDLRLDYNKGLSTWHHCHCLVYPNGKRQLIFIVDGKWC
jgi:hypothetical protein